MLDWPLWILAVSTSVIALAFIPMAILSIRLLLLFGHLAKTSNNSLVTMRQKMASWGQFFAQLLPFQNRRKRAEKEGESQPQPPQKGEWNLLPLLEGAALGLALWKIWKKRR